MKHQQGATMIIVLVVLLLVAIAGTIALRSGVFGMRLSTNSQVAKLLSNNNDSALTKFEDMDAIDIQASFALGGVYNHLLEFANAQDELVFCYNAKDPDTFSKAKAAIINPDASIDHPSGFCDATKFSSSRKAVITQIHMRKNTDVDNLDLPSGSTLSSGIATTEQHIALSLVAISVMPAFSNEDQSTTANVAAINNCLKQSAFVKATGEEVAKIGKCFADKGIPHDIQNTDFDSGNKIVVGN